MLKYHPVQYLTETVTDFPQGLLRPGGQAFACRVWTLAQGLQGQDQLERPEKMYKGVVLE